MKKILLVLVLLISIVGLIACGTSLNSDESGNANSTEDSTTDQEVVESDETEELDDNAADLTDEQKPDFAEKIEAILEIEGMEEPTTLYLYQSEGFDFSAYLPEDMIGQFEQNYFNIYTNFNDQKNEDARMFITAESKQAVIDELETNEFTVKEADIFAYEFSDEEFHLEKQGFIGRVSFFTENDQDYSIGYYYPEEFADGFSARSALIVDNIVWH